MESTDDLTVVVTNSDPVIVQQLLQTDLECIGEWCNKFQLTINSAKSKILWCYSDKDKVDYSQYALVLKNETLQVVTHFNYLGIIIDCILSMKPQCNKVLSSGNLRLLLVSTEEAEEVYRSAFSVAPLQANDTANF